MMFPLGVFPMNYTDWNQVFKHGKKIDFNPFNTGDISCSIKTYVEESYFPETLDIEQPFDCQNMAFHFNHPEHGDILIDCGLNRSFKTKPPFGNLPLVMKLFQTINNVRYTQKPTDDFETFMEASKISPAHVYLTHMHPDHTSGIQSLPNNCTVHYGKNEDTFYYRLLSGGHIRGKNVDLIDFTKGTTLAPFSKVIDIFGDGSFWAISTPGHTRDHISYLVNRKDNPVLVVGDAELSKWAMENEIIVNTDYGEKGVKDVYQSAKEIREFHKQYPHVEIHFSHDTEVLEKPSTQNIL